MTRERRLGRGLEALLGRATEPPLPGAAPAKPEASPSPIKDPVPIPTEDPLSIVADDALPFPVLEEPIQGPAEPSPEVISPSSSDSEQNISRDSTQRLDLSRIDSNPSQPRQEFDPSETRSLAESIASHGLLQPVVVRKVEDRYQLIAGERRLRAAREAGWRDVPANVIEADDRETAELAIIENLQRKNLNPLEKAAAFQQYLQAYGCTQEELAGRLNMDRSTVANLIRLLELPEAVQAAVRRGKITQGHARALLPLGEEREQIEFCERIQREGLNVRQTETQVQEIIEADDRPLGVVDREGKQSRRPRARSEHLAALEEELRLALGTKVAISHNARGRGRMVIHFRSHEEFDRLRRYLTDATPRGRNRAG